MNRTRRDNRIILDISKAQWARFYYRNQHGQTRNRLPTLDTINGEEYISSEYAYPHPDYPFETVKERAIRLDVIDKWTPEIYFKLTANASVIFTGSKAVSMNKLWRAKIFGKDVDEDYS